MEPDAIAVAIKKARLRAGLTQKQVADALEKSQTTVAAWESGRSQPDAKTLVLLSSLFHVSSDFLLGLSDFPNDNSKTFIDALLGEKTAALPEITIDRFSVFVTELIQFCNLLNEVDTDLLPAAADCLNSIVKILEDIVKAFAMYDRTYSICYASTKLANHFHSLSEGLKEKMVSVAGFQELLNEASSLRENIEDMPPTVFSAESLEKIEKASGVLAVFVLQLQAKLDTSAEFLNESLQERAE